MSKQADRCLGYSIADARLIGCQVESERQILKNRRRELLREKRIAIKLKTEIGKRQMVKEIEAVKSRP